MNWSLKEREVRIELLASLSRSQQAVARILNSVAAEAERAPGLAEAIQRNMKRLEAMQLTLTTMVSAMESSQSQRRCRVSRSAKPWLSAVVQVGSHPIRKGKGGTGK
ncbi:hypothetical protein [Paenibacillus lignilyticus]|uniref:Uncharacterized protein n=1 Tax=Paenibacillus lignilyticus TaxID=1172615 RepID=A0ABS5C858_9BACL|nr:hypothetical protein [Paenibacillus lignilyticus]MBP3962010.1 hypothetical protein [Paenibacillus lignilyticus]